MKKFLILALIICAMFTTVDARTRASRRSRSSLSTEYAFPQPQLHTRSRPFPQGRHLCNAAPTLDAQRHQPRQLEYLSAQQSLHRQERIRHA